MFSLGVALAGLSASAAAPASEPLEIARRIAQGGAVDLALERIEHGQPGAPSAASWGDWELMRLELWSRRGRDADILGRVAGYRDRALPERAASGVFGFAARAALRLSKTVDARAYLARVLLRPELPAADYREARLAVIESYLIERSGAEAYQAMLRFQQDFKPVRREEAERFVLGLLGLDRAADAANWLRLLDPASPAAALLRLRAGLIKPEAAIAQARALIAKGAGEPAWALLLAAGQAQSSRTIEIEVAEVRLNGSRLTEGAMLDARAAALWRLYVQTGQSVANDARLLSGDDEAWIERARRMPAAQASSARALLAALAAGTRSAQMRDAAHAEILTSLRDAKLSWTALQLFSDRQRFPTAQLDARARFMLGQLAAEQRLPADAVRYWQGLSPPPGMSGPQWQVRYLEVLYQAGMIDAGLEVAKSLVGTQPPLAPDLTRRMIAIASEALDVWHVRAAESLFEMLLPLSAGLDRSAVLLGLARTRELTGEFRAAAEAYLTVAVSAAAPETDREALKARESGAINLAKAGMRDDARATYEWLARNARDPAIRDNASRVLKTF